MNSKKSKITTANRVRLQNADNNALEQLDSLAEFSDQFLKVYAKNKKQGLLLSDGKLRISDVVRFLNDYEILTSRGSEQTNASVNRLRTRLLSLVGVDICSPDEVAHYASQKDGSSEAAKQDNSTPVVRIKTLADEWF